MGSRVPRAWQNDLRLMHRMLSILRQFSSIFAAWGIDLTPRILPPSYAMQFRKVDHPHDHICMICCTTYECCYIRDWTANSISVTLTGFWQAKCHEVKKSQPREPRPLYDSSPATNEPVDAKSSFIPDPGPRSGSIQQSASIMDSYGGTDLLRLQYSYSLSLSYTYISFLSSNTQNPHWPLLRSTGTESFANTDWVVTKSQSLLISHAARHHCIAPLFSFCLSFPVTVPAFG